MIIISFQGNKELQKTIDLAISLLQKHTKADQIENQVI
jgi:hypothetical protein